MAREPRFPGITWYCDHCGASLSSQNGFDDHKYTWKCRECGFKNSISWDNVGVEDSKATKFLLHVFGFLSFVGLWTTVMLGVSLFVYKAERNIYFIPFLISLAVYLIAFILSIFVEFSIRKTEKTARNIMFTIFRNLMEDVFSPLFMIKELMANIFLLISKAFGKGRDRKCNISMLISSILYILIFAAEIVAFLKINNLT